MATNDWARVWKGRGRSGDSSHSATVRQARPDTSHILLFALLLCQPVEYVLEYLCCSIERNGHSERFSHWTSKEGRCVGIMLKLIELKMKSKQRLETL